jgi:hypothetical protein
MALIVPVIVAAAVLAMVAGDRTPYGCAGQICCRVGSLVPAISRCPDQNTAVPPGLAPGACSPQP